MVVLPVSTDPAEARYEVSSRMDSVRVVLPESSTFAVQLLRVARDNISIPMWATTAKLRVFDGSGRDVDAYLHKFLVLSHEKGCNCLRRRGEIGMTQ